MSERVLIDRTTWKRFVRAVNNFARSEVGTRAMLLFAALLAFLVGINGLNVLNSYVGRDFMTAIERRDMPGFVRQASLYIGVFALSTLAAVTYRFTEERLGLLWREWLSGRLLDEYMNHRNYHRLRSMKELGNPDQRIADDTRTFVVMTLSFVLMLLNGVFTIVAFSGVLFSISWPLSVVAVVYAAVGSLATVGLGRSLVGKNYDQADREASLRSELIHVRENADSIAVTGREAPLVRRLHQRLDDVIANLKDIVRVNRNLGYFTTGYNYMIQILPALIVGPLFIRGEVEFGVITQSAMAFSHLLGAFSLIVTQFQSISSYTAVLARLSTLGEALEPGATSRPPSIEVVETNGRVAYEGLSLRSPHDDRPLIAGLYLSIENGRRLLVVSADEAPSAALFLATAGLWTAGEGRIARPGGAGVMFVPARPYLAAGTLRELLSDEAAAGAGDERMTAVLRDLGLEVALQRAGGLNAEHDWERAVGIGAQQLLVIARLILAAPQFAFLYNIDAALRPDEEQRVLRVLSERGITYVSFAGSDAAKDAHDAVLRLGPEGAWSLA